MRFPEEDRLLEIEALLKIRIKGHAERLNAPFSVPKKLFLDGGLREVTADLPDWWLPNQNRLFLGPKAKCPKFTFHRGHEAPQSSIVVIKTTTLLNQLMLWGTGCFVVLDQDAALPEGNVYCGPESTIYVGHKVTCIHAPSLSARNGVLIYVGGDNLWGARVGIMTDDMHAIIDRATNKRLNVFGGAIFVSEHVWLGQDVLVLPDTVIGDDVVIGARSLAKGRYSSHATYAGHPARLIREGTTWSREDRP